MNGQIVSAAIEAIRRAQRNLKLNQLSGSVGFGGKFSPEGQKQVAEESALDGMDLYRAHHMVGLGQTIGEGF